MHQRLIGTMLALFLAACVTAAPDAAGAMATPLSPATVEVDQGSSGAAPGGLVLAAGPLERHPSSRALPDLGFVDKRGEARHLSDFRGRVVLLNLWATWCPPCRKELPTLDHLQALLGGPGFEVVALSIDRGGLAAVTSYFDQFDVRALRVYVDSSARALSRIGGMALPTTLLIGRDGREIARHVGPAEWDRPDVVTLLRGYIDAPHPASPTRVRVDAHRIASRHGESPRRKEVVLGVGADRNLLCGGMTGHEGSLVVS